MYLLPMNKRKTLSYLKECEDLSISCHDVIDKFESVFSHAAAIHPELITRRNTNKKPDRNLKQNLKIYLIQKREEAGKTRFKQTLHTCF